MKRIFLLIEHRQNRQILAQALEQQYEVLDPGTTSDFVGAGEQMLSEDFDLCLIDYGAIYCLRDRMLARREAVIPIFLPFVFLTTSKDIGLSTDGLEELVDDIIYVPIQKIELKTKIGILLRSRCYSLQLQAVQDRLNRNIVKEQELNQIKTRFVSTVSHELRNPLNSISGMAQILETYGDKLNPEKKAEVLQQLRRNVTKMTDLIDNVLVVSQNEMGKLEFNPAPLKLEIFCRSLVAEIQTIFNDKQAIDFSYRAKQSEFKLDAKLLHHVLTNILTNACKYTPKDSQIDFEISHQAEKLVFTIRDRGIGIPDRDLPNLFNAFYRASNSQAHQGTGLGLAIAKEYVELHQGTIVVKSKLEVGTTFVVEIPIKN